MTLAANTIFARDVDQIDFAYLSSSGIEGKSYHVDVSASGPLDHNGFVIDFGLLKKQIKAHLKATADHALVLPAKARSYTLSESLSKKSDQKQLQLRYDSPWGSYGYECPADAIYTIGGTTLDPRELAKQIIADLRPHLPHSLNIQLSLREKILSEGAAQFSYTHGISRHDGLCQRLFHGHTGELQLAGVAKGSISRAQLAKALSEDCFGDGLHIASKDQLVSKASHPLAKAAAHLAESDHYFLTYEGTLGRYSAFVPKERTLLLPATASIEHLAGYVFDRLHAGHKELLTAEVELRIWEGLNKGAAISGQPCAHQHTAEADSTP